MTLAAKFPLSRRILTILFAGGLLSAAAWFVLATRADEPPADFVGAIEGDSISLQGSMHVESANGQIKTVLRSGSDVRVKSGQARIDLVEGGTITICGPAHFSVLKSSGALTIALDTGTIHVHIENEPALTIYTPQIQARPLAIGSGPQETIIGLDSTGAMCIRAVKGAVRVEQQLTGQSLLVPQSGDVSLTNGQLESLRTSEGQCACEQAEPRPMQVPTEVSLLATTDMMKKKATEQKPAATPPNTPASVERTEPIYQVFMPPLQYDANSKVQKDYDPDLVILVRRVRVRPTLIFQGRVEGEAVVAKAIPPPALPGTQKSNLAAQKPAEDSTWNRVRSFIHKIWSPSS